MNGKLQQLVNDNAELFIEQIKEWGEILIDFESRNKYRLLNKEQNSVGFAAERSNGFWGFIGRQFLRRNRPMTIDCFDDERQLMMKMSRPFFFFFSDLTVMDSDGVVLGHAYRKFGILYKKYELCDAAGITFAYIRAPLWRLWTFPIFNQNEEEVGLITKKWGGILKEIFTDADRFGVQLPGQFTWQQKVVTFAAALSIDMDFFDDNNPD